jgi:glycosyltransferase involved in cell wall biosynthesis
MNNKIAVVAHGAVGLIHNNSETEHYGGAEIQSYYVARLLSEKYSVYFVVKESLASVRSDFNCINVLYSYSEKSLQTRYLRFIYPRLIMSMKALWNAKSGIYYERGPGETVGITAVFCKIFNRKFIYAVAGNGELTDLKGKIKNPVSRFLYMTGIFLCDVILCQSNEQMHLMSKAYRKKALILRNIYPYKISDSKKYEKKHVMNIGSHRSLKRQHLFFELAQKRPDVRFVCIGGGAGQYAESLQAMAKNNPNIYMTGHITHERVIEYLRYSYCLVNCSNNEGFPNIFLEAWSCGIPVVSFGFDPDGIIRRYSLGIAVQSFAELVAGVNLMISNPDTREHFGNNGLEYVEMFHSNEVIKNQLYKIIG